VLDAAGVRPDEASPEEEDAAAPSVPDIDAEVSRFQEQLDRIDPEDFGTS
jgi:hypothetical protein